MRNRNKEPWGRSAARLAGIATVVFGFTYGQIIASRVADSISEGTRKAGNYFNDYRVESLEEKNEGGINADNYR